MPTQDYAGKVFELSHRRLVFVDARKEDGTSFKPPHIIDKKDGPHQVDQYQEFELSGTGPFILRFVLQKVDSNLIAQIYMSEYGVTDAAAAKKAVNDFIGELLSKKLLKEVTRQPKPVSGAQVSIPRQFTGLQLDFGVGLNQFGYWFFKVPF